MRAAVEGSWRERPRDARPAGARLADLAEEAHELIGVEQPQSGHQAGQRPRQGDEGIAWTGEDADAPAATAPDEQRGSDQDGQLDERPRRESVLSQAAVAVTEHVAVTSKVDGDGRAEDE